MCVCVCVCTHMGFPGGSGVKASARNAGDLGSIPGLGRSPGEGNSNPLHYSCLENPMDGGAWWATVHAVAKSRTRLSDFTHSQYICKLILLQSQVCSPVDSKANLLTPGGGEGKCSVYRCQARSPGSRGSKHMQIPSPPPAPPSRVRGSQRLGQD